MQLMTCWYCDGKKKEPPSDANLWRVACPCWLQSSGRVDHGALCGRCHTDLARLPRTAYGHSCRRLKRKIQRKKLLQGARKVSFKHLWSHCHQEWRAQQHFRVTLRCNPNRSQQSSIWKQLEPDNLPTSIHPSIFISFLKNEMKMDGCFPEDSKMAIQFCLYLFVDPRTN